MRATERKFDGLSKKWNDVILKYGQYSSLKRVQSKLKIKYCTQSIFFVFSCCLKYQIVSIATCWHHCCVRSAICILNFCTVSWLSPSDFFFFFFSCHVSLVKAKNKIKMQWFLEKFLKGKESLKYCTLQHTVMFDFLPQMIVFLYM